MRNETSLLLEQPANTVYRAALTAEKWGAGSCFFFSDKETYVISLESILFNAVKVSANPLLTLSLLLPLTHNVDFVNRLPESSQH